MSDGSAVDEVGKVLFFSPERFVRDIVKGDRCFICGASRSDGTFNDEHVIPDWILKRYDLHSHEIGSTVNQGAQIYGRFRIPCCQHCNSLMAETFEVPISKLVSAGYDAVLEHLKSNGPILLFCWLTLIFFKVHYRDRALRLHLDPRKGDETIGDLIDWGELHHIHCVARAFYNGSKFDVTALGSFVLLPCKEDDLIGQFDYADLTEAQTVLLRVGDIAFLAVLNDSCAAWNLMQNDLRRITAVPSGVQLRELMVHLAWINLRLEERPRFASRFSTKDQHFTISAELPDKINLRAADNKEFGALLYKTLNEVAANMPELNNPETRDHIREGRWRFLFRPDGSFIENSI